MAQDEESEFRATKELNRQPPSLEGTRNLGKLVTLFAPRREGMMGAFRGGPPYDDDINDLYSAGKIKQTAQDFANIKHYTMGALAAGDLLSEPGEIGHWYTKISEYSPGDRAKIETTVKSALADQNNPKPIKFVWDRKTTTKDVKVDDQGSHYVITIGGGYPLPDKKPPPSKSD